jgi:YebC/PmpR family DNA-binding regulatory protein
MSGHSKWSTIKRKKEVTDAARGKLFSRLSRAISIAVKIGGGPNPDSNHKLRVAIDAAKAANMPKANVERALSKGAGGESLEEFTFEGFGPSGVSVIVEGATDNKNRTGQEIKGIFEGGGGRSAGPGAVSHNFKSMGLLVVETKKDKESQMLDLIDLGAEDVEESEEGIEVYISPDKISGLKNDIEKKGYKIISYDLVQNPLSYLTVENKKSASSVLSFLEKLQDHEDVQKVFANVDIPQNVLENMDSN